MSHFGPVRITIERTPAGDLSFTREANLGNSWFPMDKFVASDGTHIDDKGAPWRSELKRWLRLHPIKLLDSGLSSGEEIATIYMHAAAKELQREVSNTGRELVDLLYDIALKNLAIRMQVDDVLMINWVPVTSGDYRRALNDLVTFNVRLHDDMLAFERLSIVSR